MGSEKPALFANISVSSPQQDQYIICKGTSQYSHIADINISNTSRETSLNQRVRPSKLKTRIIHRNIPGPSHRHHKRRRRGRRHRAVANVAGHGGGAAGVVGMRGGDVLAVLVHHGDGEPVRGCVVGDDGGGRNWVEGGGDDALAACVGDVGCGGGGGLGEGGGKGGEGGEEEGELHDGLSLWLGKGMCVMVLCGF